MTMSASRSDRWANSRRTVRAFGKSSGPANPAIGPTHQRLTVKGPSAVCHGVDFGIERTPQL
jgi:hypothetical protein